MWIPVCGRGLVDGIGLEPEHALARFETLVGLFVPRGSLLTTARARGRLVSTSDGYSARAAMITEYHADPISGQTQITLMITPSSPSDD